MGHKKKQINVYSDADLYEEIQRRADEEDMSMSGYMNNLAERDVQDKLLTEASRELEAEERIEELVANAIDDIEQATEEALAEIQAYFDLMQVVQLRTGMCSAGVWEMLEDEYGELRAKQAMQSASQRFEEDAKSMGIDINAIGSDRPIRRGTGRGRSTTSTNGAGTAGSGSDATGSTDESDDDDGWSY